MQIVQISDSHIVPPDSDGGRRIDDLLRCVNHIACLDRQPDVVVHTGDIAHNGTPLEYVEALGILETLAPRLYVIPGNRDHRENLRAAFARYLPDNCHPEFIQYATPLNDDLYGIMLDSVSTESSNGRLCDARLDHFRELLGHAGDRQVVIFMHHPPFDVTEADERYRFQFEDRDCLAEFAGILSRHRNVRHIYCGHSHRASVGSVAGIPASIVPSIANDLRMGPPVEIHEICPAFDLAGQPEAVQQTS